MIRLMAFDLDNTLAQLGKGIAQQDIALLKALENRGAAIAVCSGKPAYYLCGLLRQVGLRRPILIGENGAVIQFGVDLPPEESHILPCSDAAKRSLALLHSLLEQRLPNLWYQPNQVGLTPFPTSEEEFAVIESVIAEHRNDLRDIKVYRHKDSFDITPANIDKGAGLRCLAELLHIPLKDTAAVGDGPNDYPMFACAGLSLGVNVQDKTKADRNFPSITKALEALLVCL